MTRFVRLGSLPLFAGLGLLALAGRASADPLPPRVTDGLALPSQNPASLDSSSATFVNPANLAWLPGAEVRASMIRTGEASTLPVRGYALDAALPFWILATGLRVDWMVPPDGAPSPFSRAGEGMRYDCVRWGTAVKLGSLGAFGTTLAWSNASTPAMDGLFAVSSGLTLRPWNFLGASAVVRDWNSPTNEAGTRVYPSVDLGLALRPILGRRLLEVGGTASYFGNVERWGAGVTLAVDVPRVGAFRAGAQLSDFERPTVVASAGLEVNVDAAQLAGGVVFGNALTREGTGAYASAAWRAFKESPRVPSLERVVKIRIDGTLGARSLVKLLRRLWAFADDPSVAGVLLVPRDEIVGSYAHAEELADALRLLRSRGKTVLCHLEDATGKQLYVCSHADRIAMNPAGGLRFAGLSSSSLFLGGLLEKLGVRADFVRIGKYKTAAEQFTTGPSDAGEAVQRELIGEYDRLFMDGIARGRKIKANEVRARIAKGPFIAPEARDAGLIDVLAYEDEIDRFVEEAFGRRMRLHELASSDEAPEYWRSPSRVALVYLHGDMVDGESRDIPLVGIKLAGSRTIAQALRRAREDRSVKSVVFRIETGGGSSLAADVIWREAMLTAKVKPLIVSMGSRAASGGYYVAAPAREVIANAATLTGSIGIFYGKVDTSGLLDKLGVSLTTYRAEPRADAESLFRPFTDDEHEVLGRKVKQFYDLFVGRVADGRRMTPEAVHAVAEGRVWTGEQARARGLVDRVGGLRVALERARALGGLPDDAPIVEFPEQPRSLVDRALALVGVPKLEAQAGVFVPPPLVDIARALVPLTVLGFDRPMARLEWMVTEP
jgi:protease-4